MWLLWWKGEHWAGFVYDLVVLFVTYHSTTAVYLFIQICSNIRHGCPDTFSAHCDSKEKRDPFHNSLLQTIKACYCPVLITVTASYEILNLSLASWCRAFRHGIYPDLPASLQFAALGLFRDGTSERFCLKWKLRLSSSFGTRCYWKF